MRQSVFEREQESLNKARKNSQPTAEDYACLADAYEKLLRQSEKIVAIGDSTQNKLLRAQKMLHRAIQRYKNTAEQKSEILSIVSHEIKNKAAPIRELSRWVIDDLRAGPDKIPHALELLKHISDASDQLINSVNDTLQRESSRSSTIVPAFEWSNLSQMAEAILVNQNSLAKKKNIAVETDIEPDCEAYVDDFLMGEVFENLVSNAIKFSYPDSKIFVSLCRGENMLVFSVSDFGQGLDEEDMKRVFGKFQTLSAKPTGDETSSGLGLFIAHKLVTMHNGTIDVFSDGKGKGCTFTVTLPVPKEQPAALSFKNISE
ncbi:MAG: HAMP domain-containing histidine kinase [Opitutales bacterium]|nr:HAMP domain-containing histidine kinase [Opitutales bacterium]